MHKNENNNNGGSKEKCSGWKANADVREGRRKRVQSNLDTSQLAFVWDDLQFHPMKAEFTLEKGWWLMKPAAVLCAGHSWEPVAGAWLFLSGSATPQEETTWYRNFNFVHSRTWAELLALRSVELMHGACRHLFVIWNVCDQRGLGRPNDILENNAVRVKLIPVVYQTSLLFCIRHFNLDVTAKCFKYYDSFLQKSLRAS